MTPESPLIWALTDDRAGNAAQTLGVAEALGRPFLTKQIRYTPLAGLPAWAQGASLLGLDAESRAGLAAPWPGLVIAAGRRTAPVARWIKRRNPHARLVQIMQPGAGAAEFDLIALPTHDGAREGANLLRITGAPHRVTAARLAQAAQLWKPHIGLPRPWIALLVGGATHSRPFTAAMAADLGARAARVAEQLNGSLLVSTSRRTGAAAEAALAGTLPQRRQLFSWGQAGENPYLGYLALADIVIVTGDSVSMVSEACATGKPVYIYAPPGFVADKHARFHDELVARKSARRLEDFTPAAFGGCATALNASGEIAAAVERILQNRSK